MLRTVFAAILVMLGGLAPAFAQDAEQVTVGGDVFAGGETIAVTGAPDGDVFAAGRDVRVTGRVASDGHLAGFSVTVDGPVGGDLYAAGYSVTINNLVGDDLSAVGNSVNLTGSLGVIGNARIGARSITVSAPVGGTLSVGGETVTLDAAVSGDMFFGGRALSFGEAARIGGHLTIEAPEPVEVPESVAPAERITYIQAQPPAWHEAAGQTARQAVGSFWHPIIGGLIALAVLLLVGVLWLALFPKRSVIAARVCDAKPFKSLLFGFLALAMFIGLIPVLGMTLIGIPLIPVAIIVLVIAVIIGVAAGSYFLGGRIMRAFGRIDTGIGSRIIAMLVGFAIIIVLGFVPFLGWLVKLAIVIFGLGGISLAALGRWIDGPFHEQITAGVTSA